MSKKHSLIGQLAQRYSAQLQQWVERRTSCPDDAADIAQETFARLSAHENLAGITNLPGYLYRSAGHLIVDEVRRRSVRQTDPSVDLDEISSGQPDLTEHLHTQQRCSRLLNALDELPERRRQAFLLHRLEGLSYQDIADIMGVSVRTVESHIRLALAHCRRSMEP